MLLVVAACSALGGAAWNRRRLRNKWEAIAHSRATPGALGLVKGGEPIALGHGGRGVLILHGFGDTPQSVSGLARAIHERGWTVRVPLLRGHGRSLAELARARADDWLADARGALDGLMRDAESVSIVGQSMGGALATILASERPVASVVLLAPYLVLSKRARRISRFHRVVTAFVPYLQSRSDSSILDEEARRRSLGLGVTTPRLLHELAAIVRRAWASAPAVTAPTLVVNSPQDPRISVPDAEAAFAHVGAPRKSLKWARRSGHVLSVDHDRDWISSQVLEWLESNGRDGTRGKGAG